MIYNALIFIWALSLLPKALYHRKKYKERLRLPNVPPKGKKFRIWVHAVSLGETKAVIPLMRMLEKDAEVIFSSATETGQREGRKEFAHCFFLPLDFSWVMRRLVRQIEPDLFILVETDFWYNLLSELDKHGTRIVLVNGKISKRSYQRFKHMPFFAKPLLAPIDLFCVQSTTDQDRFIDLGVQPDKVHVTGNMKFDSRSAPAPEEGLYFPTGDSVVTVALTHDTEEEPIFDQIYSLGHPILLAPRHPERFAQVAKLLEKKKIPYRTISQPGDERVVLVNRMGVMDNCYAHSRAAIVGGSFVTHVGGHNIYEPARHGIPVLYGPYMYSQESIVNSLTQYGIVHQVQLSEIATRLEAVMKEGRRADVELGGGTKKCFGLIEKRLLKRESI